MNPTETVNNELAIFNKAIQNKKVISKTDIIRLLDTYRKIFAVDVVYIFEIVPTNNALIFTHVSASETEKDKISSYMKFLNEKLKTFRKKFDFENLYTISNPRSKTASFKSLIQYGAFRDENLDGCIGMIDCHTDRTWSKSERNAIIKLGRTMHYIITDSRQSKLEKNRELQLKAMQSQQDVLRSMAEIYLTVHLIDLKTDTSTEFNSFNYARVFTMQSKKASEQIKLGIFNNTLPEDQERLKKFIDFSTLEKRLGNKKSISLDFCGIHMGWVRAQFIVSEFDEKNHLSKVVFTTQVINEEKQKELNLLRISNTDELTQANNRRCYEYDIKEFSKKPLDKNFTLASFDLNSLKIANDERGHAAGDELLQGVVWCISEVFGKSGKIYRTGGDEFACIFFSEKNKMYEMLKKFHEVQKNWKGSLNDNISISTGYARADEHKSKSIHELEKIADQMMYTDKKSYYENKEHERRS